MLNSLQRHGRMMGAHRTTSWRLAYVLAYGVLVSFVIVPLRVVVAADHDGVPNGTVVVYSDPSHYGCYAEPVGVGECGLNLNATAEPTTVTYYTARFGIPHNKTNDNDQEPSGISTTAVGPRIKYCRYGWQVITTEEAWPGAYSFKTTILNSSDLTASDPNCPDTTGGCSAVIPSMSGSLLTDEPANITVRHRFYVVPIFEGQETEDEAASPNWNPFPTNPSGDLPPKSATLRVNASGCFLEAWDPVPTSTPTTTPPPSSTTPSPAVDMPSHSSRRIVATALTLVLAAGAIL